MIDAPERIWAWAWEVDRHRGQWSTSGDLTGEIEYIRADRIEALAVERDALAEKLERAVEALEAVIRACEEGRMAVMPGCGVGGMTIESNIRGSVYMGVPAWPVEEARATLAAITGAKSDD